MRWLRLLCLLGFALRRGSACPGRWHPLARAVETCQPHQMWHWIYSTLTALHALACVAVNSFRLPNAHLVELAGFEPASSTHPLQPSGSVSAATRPSSLQADEAQVNLIRHAGIEPTLSRLNGTVLQHTPGAAVKTFKIFTVDWSLYRDSNPGRRVESAVS